MLRAKHLGTLSQSARSLLFNGPRCSAADGSACSCSDDDNCISKRHLVTNARHFPASSPPSLPKVSLGVGSLALIDSGDAKAVKPETKPVSQVIGTSTSHERANRVSYVDEIDEKEITHSSPPIAEHFVKAGMAAVGLLSDLVHYRIPMTEGSAMVTSSQKYVVNHAKSVSNERSASTKTYKKDKTVIKSLAEPATVSSSTVASITSKVREDDSASTHRKHKASNIIDTHGVSYELHEKKRSIPRKSRAYSSQTAANTQPQDRNLEGRSRFVRELKVYSGSAPVNRQFSHSTHAVETVSRVLQRLKWGPAAEEALGNLNISVDAYQANQIIKQLQDYSVALGFFHWLKWQPGFKHDDHTYTTMIGIVGRAKQFGIAKKLLDQMVDDGCKPNIVTYNRLIHSYGKANYLNEALGVFHQMQKMGCKPDRVTYCTLIDIHAKAGYLDVAIDMYHRMQEAGLSPDTFTYSVIINCLGKGGHLAAAHKLFCEMVDQGCVPNLVTYNIMIALHAKARNYQNALQLYHDMQGAGFEPDKVTYSIVMEVLGQCGYLEEAEAVFAEMKRKNWIPDEPVYGLLVDLWGKAGNVEKAREWYRTMLNAGLCPNVPTCNSLLSAFLRVHRLPDAHALLQNMLSLGLNPSLQTYTLLLSCCTEAQTSLDMTFCCELMTITNHPAHAFLLSMPSPEPNGQNIRNHVSTFLDLMHSEDRESKRGLVDAVIDFFHKTGLKEEAGSIWEVAAQKNIYPDAVRQKSSCYWLINLHIMSDGTAVTALSRTLALFRREMLVSGICPNRIDIITGWGRRSRVSGASLVRQAVQDLLSVFKFPFFIENGNSGCFIGCGEALNRWLLQPYVERMHLL